MAAPSFSARLRARRSREGRRVQRRVRSNHVQRGGTEIDTTPEVPASQTPWARRRVAHHGPATTRKAVGRLASNARVPGTGEEGSMFEPTGDDSIVQRGIDEALACRDMLVPAPALPSLSQQLLTRLGRIAETLARRSPAVTRW